MNLLQSSCRRADTARFRSLRPCGKGHVLRAGEWTGIASLQWYPHSGLWSHWTGCRGQTASGTRHLTDTMKRLQANKEELWSPTVQRWASKGAPIGALVDTTRRPASAQGVFASSAWRPRLRVVVTAVFLIEPAFLLECQRESCLRLSALAAHPGEGAGFLSLATSAGRQA